MGCRPGSKRCERTRSIDAMTWPNNRCRSAGTMRSPVSSQLAPPCGTSLQHSIDPCRKARPSWRDARHATATVCSNSCRNSPCGCLYAPRTLSAPSPHGTHHFTRAPNMLCLWQESLYLFVRPTHDGHRVLKQVHLSEPKPSMLGPSRISDSEWPNNMDGLNLTLMARKMCMAGHPAPSGGRV